MVCRKALPKKIIFIAIAAYILFLIIISISAQNRGAFFWDQANLDYQKACLQNEKMLVSRVTGKKHSQFSRDWGGSP